MTLQEVIDLARALNESQGRNELAERLGFKWGLVGLYIELKSVEQIQQELAFDMPYALHETLTANDLGSVTHCTNQIPIIVQSFDFNALKSFSTFSDLPLIYLFFNNEMPSDFTEAIEVIHGVGPSYEILFKEKFLD